jgi:uracil-DNA glycosylase
MVNLHPSWLSPLQREFDADYMHRLKAFLSAERDGGKQIFPKGSEWFHALNATPLDQVRVVILGQDPYHGQGQAHGLCFSVPEGVAPPPSLLNIFKELQTDLGLAAPSHGNLEAWTRQGVLLLNSVLTVEAHRAASHAGKGWESFTDAVIREVNALHHPVVFVLWGNYAQKKASFVDASRHHIIKSVHPSPLSAYNGFFGSRPFSRTNAFLKTQGQQVIDWCL